MNNKQSEHPGLKRMIQDPHFYYLMKRLRDNLFESFQTCNTFKPYKYIDVTNEQMNALNELYYSVGKVIALYEKHSEKNNYMDH